MYIIQKRKIFFAISILFVAISVFLMAKFGLKLGIDFRGGTLIEVQGENLSSEEIKNQLAETEVESLSVQSTQDNSFLVRFTTDEDAKNDLVQNKIKELSKEERRVSIKRVEFISSVVSDELKRKALGAVILASIAVAIFIAIAFRKVSYPVESWKYGVAAIVALLHDVIITVGAFSFLGWKCGIEVNTPFIAALLTILGYSVNDTIVVFDRIRENLNRAGAKKNFEETVNLSIRQTLARSVNTSLTVIIVLVAIVLFGGASIRDFSAALLIGVIFGTYSSVFVASSLVVELWQRKK